MIIDGNLTSCFYSLIENITVCDIHKCNFAGDDLKLIVKNMRISNVLDGRPDRHFVSVESLSVVQHRSELKDRSLSSKGTKAALVRLKEAIGEGQKVIQHILHTI